MDILSNFVNYISAYQLNIPGWLIGSIIFLLIVLFVIGGYFLRDMFDMLYLKSGFVWFLFIAIVNLSTIFIIFVYYTNKPASVVGVPGIKGKKGKKGKKGTSVSCGYCKNNIYLQKVRKSNTICTLSAYTKEFQPIYDNYNYFQNMIDKGSNIDYYGFLNTILVGKSLSANISQTFVDKFTTLMTPSAIAVSLIKVINQGLTSASDRTYGTFRTPVPKVGYVALGDEVYGGTDTFGLNSFVVNGNIMYPAGFNKLVSFQSYNEITGDYDIYTIWQLQSQTVNDVGFGGTTEQHEFLPLGDVCNIGINNPKINDYAMIKDTCLEQVNSQDLKLVFIYAGNIQSTKSSISPDYTQEDTYLIENDVINDIEIYSVWRTPMNTFITNCNSLNKLTNDTVLANIINETADAYNEFGGIISKYRQWVNDKLKNVLIPQIVVAMLYSRHFEMESMRELIYYINKYQSQVPELRGKSINKMSFSELMNLVKTIKTQYEDYNSALVKKASLSLSDSSDAKPKPTRYKYNTADEKRLPIMIMKTYENINTALNTLAVQVENTSTLLDVIKLIIPNGLEGRIAVDSDGIAQGGVILNAIQETVVRISKMLFPPNRPVYIIKDECLGTFTIDKERESIIREFTDEKEKYNKIIDIITNNYDKYSSQIITIRAYEDLSMKKIGQLCGHISNYMDKVHNLELDEFTTNRIKGLISIYKEINDLLNNIVNQPV